MSVLDDVFKKLSDDSVKDAEIKAILDRVKAFSELFPDNKEAQDMCAKAREAAEAKMTNKDIKSVSKIENLVQMEVAMDAYFSRPANLEKEALLAERLGDLSEEKGVDGKKLYNLAEDFMTNNTILKSGETSRKESFAGTIASVYAVSVDNTKYTPMMARNMLVSLKELSPYLTDSATAFANCAVCLEDKKTAEMFVKYSMNALNSMEEAGSDTFLGAQLIGAYKEIVSHHSEMAKDCLVAAKKTCELTDKLNTLETYEAAAEFFHTANENPQVSERDKVWARTYDRTINTRINKMKDKDDDADDGYQMEYSYERTQRSKSHKKKQEIDFSRDYDYGR